MSILSDFEDRLASAIEGVFGSAFRSPVQPAEIAKALARAMDDRKVAGVGSVWAPHAFTVALSVSDDEAMAPYRPTLSGELAAFLTAHAASCGYKLAARPSIAFIVHDDLALGRIRVAAQSTPEDTMLTVEPDLAQAAQPRPQKTLATVTVTGIDHDVVLTGERVTVGRVNSCLITLRDANVSREHAAFVKVGAGWMIEDLDSTNGTLLNGEPITRAHLSDGDRIIVGTSELVFNEPRR